MPNDNLIAALQRAAAVLSWEAPADSDLIRALIADLRAGNLVRREDVVALNGDFACAVAYDSGHTAGATQERAKVVAYLRRVGLTPKARDLFATAAGHIAAGAHEGDDAPA